jgi:hypothetical protein
MDGLERRVEILEQLPERVTALEVQIVQLRDEMRKPGGTCECSMKISWGE